MLSKPVAEMGFPEGSWCATEPFGTLFVWGYDNVRAVFADQAFAVPEIEELSFGAVTEGPAADWARLSPSFRDGAEHRKIRAASTKAFSPTAVAALGPMIQEVANTVISELPHTGSVDLVRAVGQRLPMSVFGRILGIPDGQLEEIAPDIHAMTRLFTWSSGEWKDKIETAVEILYALVDSVRDHPTDLVTKIESAGLPDETVRHLLTQLLVGGWETTGAQISNLLWVLSDPDHWATFKAVCAESSYRQVALETARFKPSTVAVARVCRTDTAINDVVVPAGTWVALAIGWSARDPDKFSDPDTWDPRRYEDPQCPEPLAFGIARHRCVGERLAYLELDAVARAIDELGPPAGWALEGDVEWADKDRPIQPLALTATRRG